MDMVTLREARKLTQAKVAKELKVVPMHVSNIENRRSPIPAKHVRKLAKLYKVPVELIVKISVERFANSYRKRVG